MMINRTTCPSLLLLSAALLGSCGGNGESALSAPGYVATPAVEVAPDAFTPMVAEVFVATDQLATVSVRVIYENDDIGPPFTSDVLDQQHTVAVLGLHPGELHELEVTIENVDGLRTVWDETISIAVDPVAGQLPPMEITSAPGVARTPGYLMFCASGTDPDNGAPLSHISILDEDGELYWYHRSQSQITDLRRLRNGNLLFIYNNLGLREMTMTGAVVNEWWASGLTTDPAPAGAILVPIDSFHHEVAELPEGDEADFLVLSSALRTELNYPTTVVNPTIFETASVVTDMIYTMKRDGTIVDTWDIADIIDITRLSYDSLGPFWAQVYGADSRDWSHANAAIYDEVNDEIIVSARHQEAVFAFGRTDGLLHWILGDHDQWGMPFATGLFDPPVSPSEGFEWSYHQHSPVLTGPNTIMLFDNGNNRAVAPADPQAGDSYSRAVEYEIDRTSNTISQIWAYGGAADPWYSQAVGDADPLPGTDNVLVTDGFRFEGALRWARVFEVTRDGDVIFEVKVQSDPGPTASNWLIYRATHLPTLP